jgi:hypothetical protein
VKIDSIVMHSDDMGAVVGDFHGTPIREVNFLDVELRELGYAQMRARLFLADKPTPIELLPGEVIVNHLIRKATTREAQNGN